MKYSIPFYPFAQASSLSLLPFYFFFHLQPAQTFLLHVLPNIESLVCTGLGLMHAYRKNMAVFKNIKTYDFKS
jgi:hypothetical protein